MPRYEILDDPTDVYPESTCCCGFIRAREGAAIIGMIQFSIALIFTLHTLLWKMNSLSEFVENSIPIPELVVTILLLWGIKREDFRLLIPYLVFEVCFLSLFFKLLTFRLCFSWFRLLGWSGIFLTISEIQKISVLLKSMESLSMLPTQERTKYVSFYIISYFWILF